MHIPATRQPVIYFDIFIRQRELVKITSGAYRQSVTGNANVDIIFPLNLASQFTSSSWPNHFLDNALGDFSFKTPHCINVF